jgi:hypothetical protein
MYGIIKRNKWPLGYLGQFSLNVISEKIIPDLDERLIMTKKFLHG